MSRHILWGVCLLVGSAVACSTSGDSGDDNDDDDGGDVVVSTYADVTSVAKMIYDAVEAGEDVTPHIEAVFEAFDVPILPPDEVADAVARIDDGLPFVTTLMVQRMAEAYASKTFIAAEGIGEGLVEQGVGLAYPFNLGSEPLSSAFLGSMIYAFTAGAEDEPDVPMEEGTVLPTLIRALGQERASRENLAFVDPIWADGNVDPLQFTLLSFTIFAKPASPDRMTGFSVSGLDTKSHFQTNPGADFIKNAIKDKIKDSVEGELTSVVQDVVEVPLDKGDAAKVSVCGSLILYGHKLTMTNTPNVLWHRPKAPNVTQVELTLTFEDDYHNNWARAVLGSVVTDLTGCNFPRQGPIEGKQIKWSVSSGIEAHGDYDLMGTVTNEDGKSLASWRTIEDNTPPVCQIFQYQRDAVGATEARVTGLLSGWSTVETAVNFLNPNTGGQGNAPLTVLYYEPDPSDPCHPE